MNGPQVVSCAQIVTVSTDAQISAPTASLHSHNVTEGASDRPTYDRILKSTALIGGSSVVNIAFGIVRTKAMALFLGPAGVGLMGLYGSVADLTCSIAGMGIHSSGVRQIAEAVGTGDPVKIARTVTVLKRVSVFFGLIGAGLLVLFASPISQVTFGSSQQTAGVALLSVAVFFRLVSGGQGALIQGMRRISDLARMNALAGLLGTGLSIPIVYFFREQGVVPSLVAIAAVSILTSWWYSRKIHVEPLPLKRSEAAQAAAALLKLGVAFMASGVLTMGAAYVVRLIVLRKIGVEAAGLYQSAWALGGLYVGFILQAMGADFYPRLTAISKDDAACNRLVNEQAQISLLLAGPGVIATLTLAPLVIALFYSARFTPAVEILRWICLGMTLRIIAWPMGFIVVARGAQQIFFWTEVAAMFVHVGLAWWLVAYIGVAGSGAAFCGLYVWHACLIYLIVRRMTGFRWSVANMRAGMLFLPLVLFVFCSFYVMPFRFALTCGTFGILFSTFYSIRTMLHLVSMEHSPLSVRQLVTRFRVIRQGGDGCAV